MMVGHLPGSSPFEKSVVEIKERNGFLKKVATVEGHKRHVCLP
jgi:hypothetical protein